MPRRHRTGSVAAADDPGRLLKAYDEQLRGAAEVTPGAMSMTRHGPLHRVPFHGGRG